MDLSDETRAEISQISPEYVESRSGAYKQVANVLGVPLELRYQQLTPSQKYDIHRSAVREYLLYKSELTQQQKQDLLSKLNLDHDPFKAAQDGIPASEVEQNLEIQRALTQELASQINKNPEVSVAEQLNMELSVQQIILKSQLEQLSLKEQDARNVQDQMRQYLSEQTEASNPNLEQKIVNGIISQSQQLLPVLSPKQFTILMN